MSINEQFRAIRARMSEDLREGPHRDKPVLLLFSESACLAAFVLHLASRRDGRRLSFEPFAETIRAISLSPTALGAFCATCGASAGEQAVLARLCAGGAALDAGFGEIVFTAAEIETLSPTELVETAYRVYFGLEPDPGGLETHVNSITIGGVDRRTLLDVFSRAEEAAIAGTGWSIAMIETDGQAAPVHAALRRLQSAELRRIHEMGLLVNETLDVAAALAHAAAG